MANCPDAEVMALSAQPGIRHTRAARQGVVSRGVLVELLRTRTGLRAPESSSTVRSAAAWHTISVLSTMASPSAPDSNFRMF